MKTKFYFPILALGILLLFGSAKPDNSATPEKMVLIKTKYGDMKVKLYNETPQHRDNFLKLAGKGFFDELLFHRVIKGFMIQGGDPQSKNAKPGKMLGTGDVGYEIPAEFNSKFIHKKGALAAARSGDDVNPQKKSSGCQFYIVQGRTWNNKTLNNYVEKRNSQAYKEEMDKLTKPKLELISRLQLEGKKDSINIINAALKAEVIKKFDAAGMGYDSIQRKTYNTLGGTPNLDAAYTVFGEVVEGLNIIDSIANVQTDKADRPVGDVKMWIKVIE
jgi:cyclophilin family peptidyl-prolyl cis-trans isomerase